MGYICSEIYRTWNIYRVVHKVRNKKWDKEKMENTYIVIDTYI